MPRPQPPTLPNVQIPRIAILLEQYQDATMFHSAPTCLVPMSMRRHACVEVRNVLQPPVVATVFFVPRVNLGVKTPPITSHVPTAMVPSPTVHNACVVGAVERVVLLCVNRMNIVPQTLLIVRRNPGVHMVVEQLRITTIALAVHLPVAVVVVVAMVCIVCRMTMFVAPLHLKIVLSWMAHLLFLVHPAFVEPLPVA